MKLHIKKFQKVGKISIPIYETKSALDFLTSKAHLNYNHRSRVRVTFPAPKNLAGQGKLSCFYYSHLIKSAFETTNSHFSLSYFNVVFALPT